MDVIIHVGLPKTATTSLQSDFFPYKKGVNYLGNYTWNYTKETPHFLEMENFRKSIINGNLKEAKKILLINKIIPVHIQPNFQVN